MTHLFKKNKYSLYFDDIQDCCIPFINYSNMVITDKSSLIGETLLLNKPIYITEENNELSKELVDDRLLLNKTEILIDLPHEQLESFDKDYIFDNKHSCCEYIILESIKLYHKKY